MPSEAMFKAHRPLAPKAAPSQRNPPSQVKQVFAQVAQAGQQLLTPKSPPAGYDPLLPAGAQAYQPTTPSMWAQYGLPEWTPYAAGVLLAAALVLRR